MKPKHTQMALTAVAAAIFLATTAVSCTTDNHEYAGKRLVILHTNDTHSQIDPDDKGRGGILRRKVLIDSVRGAEENVLLIDAGDAVQGTLYFTLYNGEVERKMMNELGYDVQILGNHEFDNGMESLARQYREINATKITTNYDLSGTELETLFVPYAIKEYSGRRIGIIGINLNPSGIIDEKNCTGVKYLDAIKTANATAQHLKATENADAIIAVTHVGYDESAPPTPSDLEIARNSENIDIIIGGHSHTLINPDSPDCPIYKVANNNGDSVLIVQTEKGGRYLGEITLALDNMQPSYRLIPVNDRLDGRIDSNAAKLLKPYRHGVDSLMVVKVATSTKTLDSAEPALLNMVTDFVLQKGSELTAANIDLAIMNKGGIRRSLPEGDITKGMIITMLPFENHITVLELKGIDLKAALDVMAGRHGDGVSKGVKITYDDHTGKCTGISINGQRIEDNRIYRIATIDYLANGGDYMKPFTNGRIIGKSEQILYDDLLDYLESDKMKGKSLNPSNEERMTKEK